LTCIWINYLPRLVVDRNNEQLSPAVLFAMLIYIC
jgi:hypothetical protein